MLSYHSNRSCVSILVHAQQECTWHWHHPSFTQITKGGQCNQSTSSGDLLLCWWEQQCFAIANTQNWSWERCKTRISTRHKMSWFIPSILILLPGNTWYVNLSAALFPDYNNQYPHHTKYHISALITKLQRSTVRENHWWHLTLDIAFLFIIFKWDIVA